MPYAYIFSFIKLNNFLYITGWRLKYKYLQAAGISVEFCSHIVHAYVTSTAITRIAKTSEVLSVTGSSVSTIKCREK